jgi:Trypsin-like peptidase domain
VTPDKVALRFDYKALEDGVSVRSGTVYELAPGAVGAPDSWLIDSSRYSKVDTEGGPGDPSAEHMDYALLRVKGKPGADPVGGPQPELEKPVPRGWIEIPAREHDFEKFKSVFILQHPDDRPLKFAMDTNSVLGLNGNATRVRYATNTAPGSSGAPCFDGDWNLIALHHAGDPKYGHLFKAEYNQGIPLKPILALLTEHKVRDLLGRP